MNSNATIVRNSCYLIASIAVILFVSSPAFSFSKKLNFTFSNTPMTEVAKQISQQIGYDILMDSELADTSVSGRFVDTTLEDLLTRRVFRGKNIVILFDDTKRTITIKTLKQGQQQAEHEYVSIASMAKKVDYMDLEVTEGVLRRDVIPSKNNVDPMDLEVTEGVVRRDVKPHSNNTDPMDLDVTEGVLRRDVIPSKNNVDPMDLEVTEGVVRRDVKPHSNQTDPMDLDITEGFKRRNLLAQ